MFTCIGLFIQSIFMCQLFFICLVYILLCSLGLFNNWVGFLITQVYFIVFIEVLWLGGGIHFLVGLGVNVGLGWIDYDCLFLLARMNVILEINFYQGMLFNK
ncbi:hypothetical protein D1Z24_00510 [Campylobacter coli]|nr:hypothetical protein [Campylobacter coli]EAJ9790952.1 hypothetical protein [Campylobacter coli]EAK1453856.1 hypothetical protein [Campylobacter coli]EAM0189499.1 hypothetical protein [Campylobacter coli]ECC0355875.1 hypothetical protein [Campylobacter coli]